MYVGAKMQQEGSNFRLHPPRKIWPRTLIITEYSFTSAASVQLESYNCFELTEIPPSLIWGPAAKAVQRSVQAYFFGLWKLGVTQIPGWGKVWWLCVAAGSMVELPCEWVHSWVFTPTFIQWWTLSTCNPSALLGSCTALLAACSSSV